MYAEEYCDGCWEVDIVKPLYSSPLGRKKTFFADNSNSRRTGPKNVDMSV